MDTSSQLENLRHDLILKMEQLLFEALLLRLCVKKSLLILAFKRILALFVKH